MFLRLQDEQQIAVEEQEARDDQYLEIYHPSVAFDAEGFSVAELHALESVIRMSRGKRTRELVALSHEEQARKDNEPDRQLIDYQRYAFGVGV